MKTKIYGWNLLSLSILPILIAGCATTRITSQVNPEVVSRNFDNVLVYGNFANLEYRKRAEKKLCWELNRKSDCHCFRSTYVFFPGQTYSGDEISDRINELEIDGVLILQPTGSGLSSTYIPQTTHTTGSAQIFGNKITGSSTTETYGGYNVNKPWANYEAIFWSISEGKVAWYATATSGGNAFANWNDLINSACGKTIKKLAADGIIR